MKIPEQILNVLRGTDALLIPPANEGTQPTQAELFAQQYLEFLLGLGLKLATDDGNPEVAGDETYLLFNPTFFDETLVLQAAEQSRLAEFVNGLGNNQKPIEPKALVEVVSKRTGETIRDILTDTPETTETAVLRNQTADTDVRVVPATNETLLNAIRRR